MKSESYRYLGDAVTTIAKVPRQQRVSVLLALKGCFGGLRRGQTDGVSHKATPLHSLHLSLHPVGVKGNYNLCSSEVANSCLIRVGVKNVFEVG